MQGNFEALRNAIIAQKIAANKAVQGQQSQSIVREIKRNNEIFGEELEKIQINKKLSPQTNSSQQFQVQRLPQTNFNINEDKIITEKSRINDKERLKKKVQADLFDKNILKRLKKKEKKALKKKIKKPSHYVKISNSLFSGIATKLAQKKSFESLKKDLVKANLAILPTSYISVMFFTTLISFFIGLLVFGFLMFFNILPSWPILSQVTEPFTTRFLKIFWIIFAVPLASFVFMYFYPDLEKKSNEHKIDAEMPFATIHMAAISGSMIEPSKIFSILITTEEYPAINREFIKIINEVNIYGYDLVSALRNTAEKSPSKKLAELLNGMATTINSGGSLPDFFDKRAQSLLFEYRLEKEKKTRAAETFMDIYISVVIAAPMIFMLLLMMIKISGLGIDLSNSTITLLMVLGVTAINIIFLTFLSLKSEV